MIQLLHGDCLELLPTLPKIDAVITDPPYGIKYSPNQVTSGSKAWGAKRFVGNTVVFGDDSDFDPAPFLFADTVVLFGANHYASRLPDSPNWIVWDKRAGVGSNDFADCELAWTNRKGVARVFRYLWMGAIRTSKATEEIYHPTQKPLALMKWVIENYTKPNDLVLDPYAGSFTTGVACVLLGRQFIGIERELSYYEIGQRRIAEAQMQPALFTEAA